MHGHWQRHQQYLHTGIGPSPLSEVTHKPWIMLLCSRLLRSQGRRVWPLLNVVSLLSSRSSHPHHHTFQPPDQSRKVKQIKWTSSCVLSISLTKCTGKTHSFLKPSMKEKSKSSRSVKQRSTCLIFFTCLFKQLSHGAALAVCLSVHLWSFFSKLVGHWSLNPFC